MSPPSASVREVPLPVTDPPVTETLPITKSPPPAAFWPDVVLPMTTVSVSAMLL